MKIEDQIKQHFLDKLINHYTLLIYDESKRYHEIVLSINEPDIKIIDGSNSLLLAHEQGMNAWQNFETDGDQRLIFYLPVARPIDNDEKIFDAFYIFSFGGQIFPYSADDNYIEIAKKAFPKHKEKIDELFQNQIPTFAMLNNLESGTAYPILQSLLNETSAKEIIVSILYPKSEEIKNLNTNKTWHNELQQLVKQYINYTVKEKNLEKIQSELWRYLLFSEFVFDLPVALPSELKNVAKADSDYKEVVNQLCNKLRNQSDSKHIYIEQAQKVSQVLNLEHHFKNEPDLGEIVTFAFEDNTYFNQFIDFSLKHDFAKAENLLNKQTKSIWLQNDNERKNVWAIGEYGFEILKEIEKNELILPKIKNLEDLIQKYSTQLYLVDRNQRYFEKSVINQPLTETIQLQKFIQTIRTKYYDYIVNQQNQFLEFLNLEGWKTTNSLRNIDIFDHKISTQFNSKNKICYIMVDALRFELGKEIEQSLSTNFEVNTLPSRAYLPTVTKYGMAALLPEANRKLELKEIKGEILPVFENKTVCTPSERFEIFSQKYGSRVEMKEISEYIKYKEISESTELLILRTTEIDKSGENLGVLGIESMQISVQNILKVIHSVFQKGFKKIFIVTDHGFVLLPDYKMGDELKVPAGNWLLKKTRVLAGKGETNDYLLNFSADKLDINSKIEQFMIPKNYGVFRKGTTFYHEGISLLEAVVPFIEIENKRKEKETQQFQLNLSYQRKTSSLITTHCPMIEVSIFSQEMFLEKEIKIEAICNNKIVGKIQSGENVNPTTNYISIKNSQSFKIPLYIDEDFEGKFEVIASDPITDEIFSTIILEFMN